jgi:hypothetical protein
VRNRDGRTLPPESGEPVVVAAMTTGEHPVQTAQHDFAISS